jgi:hypothetical protein
MDQIPKWNNSTQTWVCGNDLDTDTTYSAGTGLDLDGTTLGITTTYRLPQGCSSDEVAKWDGTNWSCAPDLTGGSSGWSLTGNAGTTAGINFLGTTDNQPLELRTNNLRALRLEPDTISPNIIGGYGGNSAAPGTSGATIGGGGRDVAVNQVDGDFSTVGGGAGNTAEGYALFLGGGEGNSIYGSYSSATGGSNNLTIGDYSSIHGGQNNTTGASYTTIGGGIGNVVSGTFGTSGGGALNLITDSYGTIPGGNYNWISAAFGTIGGGGPSDPGNPLTSNNQVLDDYGTISGGGGNIAGSDDSNPNSAPFTTISGGQQNIVSGTYGTVGGGYVNTVGGYGGTTGGGTYNTAAGNNAVVAGGTNNTADGNAASIGGGNGNLVDVVYGTIPGGYQNYVSGAYGFAAGFQARAEHQGSFIWSGSTGVFGSTANSQFLIDAPGGVGIGTNTPSQMLSVQGSGIFMGGDTPVARGTFTSNNGILDTPNTVFVKGNEVYVTSSSTNTLAVFDASDPDNIVVLGHSTSNLSQPNDVFVSGERAYVTSGGNNRLVIFDVANPSAIDSLGSTDEGLAGPQALHVAGKYAYVASRDNDRLAIYDISDPTHIRLRDSSETYLDGPSDVFVAGSRAYVTSRDNHRLVVFDVSDPRPGQIKALGYITDTLIYPNAVFVSGSNAFVIADPGKLVIFDISDPNNIAIRGSSTLLQSPSDVTVVDNLVYVTNSMYDCLDIFDVSDPTDIILLECMSTGWSSQPLSVFASGKNLYVAAGGSDMLSIYEISHLAAPTLESGGLRTGYLDVSGNAVIENDLAVFGGLQVGPNGALIGGGLSVAGPGDSHILGALSVGGAGQLISDTILLTRTLWVTGPTHALDVVGEGRFRVNDYNNVAIRSPNAGGDEDAYIDFFSSDQSTILTPTARIEFDAADPVTHTTSIRFHTQGSDDSQPLSRLEITSFGDVRPGADAAYLLGIPGRRWEAVYAVNGTIQTSDIRYKENLNDLIYGLEEVKALRPVSFNWTNGPEEEIHFGLVAQEVMAVLPEVVEVGDDPQGTLGMNYSELVPVLIHAVQEQQAEIEKQGEQIASLEARLNALEENQGGTKSGTTNLNSLSWIGILGLAVGAVLVTRKKR